MTKQLKTKLEVMEYDDQQSIIDSWNDKSEDTKYDRESLVTIMYYGGQRINGKQWADWLDCVINLDFNQLDKPDQDFLIRLHNARIKRYIDEDSMQRRKKND